MDMKKTPYITKEDYIGIKSGGLDFNKISKKHLKKDELEHFDFQKVLQLDADEGGSFANYSSFAVWHDQSQDALIEQKKSLELLQDWDGLNNLGIRLRSDYVFLGVNAAAKGFDMRKDAGNETFDHFEMFQLRTIPNGEGQQKGIPCAFKYQRAFINHDEEHKDFYNENIRGAYMTDFIKGLPTNYGNDIDNYLKKISSELNYTKEGYEDLFNRFANLFSEILINELEVLGGRTHTLIVMGAKSGIVNNLVSRSGLDKKYKIKNIPHYSGSIKYDKIRAILKEIINED